MGKTFDLGKIRKEKNVDLRKIRVENLLIWGKLGKSKL